MLAIIITIALFCVLMSAAAGIGSLLGLRRDRIGFNVIGVTNERRTVELLCALQAAHQAKADAALEREYDDAVALNRQRRAMRHSRLYLVELDREEAPVHPFSIRRQAF